MPDSLLVRNVQVILVVPVSNVEYFPLRESVPPGHPLMRFVSKLIDCFVGGDCDHCLLEREELVNANSEVESQI